MKSISFRFLVLVMLSFVAGLACAVDLSGQIMAPQPGANNAPASAIRDYLPDDFSIELGMPGGTGFSYFRNINPFVAIGFGAGYTYPGAGGDVDVKGYFFTGGFTPYINVGTGYNYYDSGSSAVTVNGGAGLEYIFADNGWGLSLGVGALKGLNNTDKKMPIVFGNDLSQRAINVQAGIHFRY